MINIDLDWEEISCIWCGSTSYAILFLGPDRLEGLPGNFTLVRCNTCGLIRQNPRLVWKTLKNYYPEDYSSYSKIDNKNIGFRHKIKTYGNWKKKRAIEHLISGGRLIDVGCGTGDFLEEMHRSGNWDLHGIEPNNYAASIAQEKLGLPIHNSIFREANFENNSCDVITLWCVLEHMEDPLEDLRLASLTLKQGGWLIFSIPNCESIEVKLFGEYWAGWDLPRHLYLFPRSVLYNILDQLGFRVIDERCISTSHTILGHSIEFWSQSWENEHPFIKRVLVNGYRSWLGKLMMLAPLKVFDLLRLSSTLTIFAQKI